MLVVEDEYQDHLMSLSLHQTLHIDHDYIEHLPNLNTEKNFISMV